jgi:hypothetical protein
MVELLRGHGGTLKRVTAYEGGAHGTFESAVLAGALPNLTYFSFNLWEPIHRDILSGGMLPLLEEVRLNVDRGTQGVPLEHLRHLSHLRSLWLLFEGARDAVFPPFIPRSLKSLYLYIEDVASFETVLRELPPMLQASGAALEEIDMLWTGCLSAERGAALARILRTCSPSLKAVKLKSRGEALGSACALELWSVLMSCCATLEVLHCPWALFSALPATRPTFPRLDELYFDGDSGAIDLASPAWDVMTNGRLPALASLSIRSGYDFVLSSVEGEGAASEGGGRLARAFEAVAGTLRRLTLSRHGKDTLQSYQRSYELGVAIGKLRRLRHLELTLLFSDGRHCHAVARGLAASGGCPELLNVTVDRLGSSKGVLFTCEPSLIVPSVRDLTISGHRFEEEEALLLCCGLVQMGYKHLLRLRINLRGVEGSPLLLL